MNENAIVTLAIGESYLRLWQKYCASSWQAYARKYQFDLIVLTEPLDYSTIASSRSVAWQKCLTLSQPFAQHYRQVVLLDCDIVINHEQAPNIIEQTPAHFVGGVISGSHLQEDLRVVLLSRLTGTRYEYRPRLKHWREDQKNFYSQHGLSPIEAGIVQTGVLVANPERHRAVFEKVYSTRFPIEDRGYEQIPLSHALLTAGIFQGIDTRFNSVFYETLVVHYPFLMNRSLSEFEVLVRHAVRSQFENNFFLHFAYDAQFMRYLLD
jgi:hypothetical protein